MLRPHGDRVGKIRDAGEDAAAQALVCQFFEPPLDQVQRGTRRRAADPFPMVTPIEAVRGVLRMMDRVDEVTDAGSARGWRISLGVCAGLLLGFFC